MTEMFYVDQSLDGNATLTGSVSEIIPEIWGARVLPYMEDELVFGGLPGVMDRSLVGTAGDLLHLGIFDQVSAKGASTAENASAAVTELTTSEITLQPTEYTNAVQITQKMFTRTIVNMMDEAMARLGRGLGEALEEHIVTALAAAVNATTNAGQLIDKTGSQVSANFLADARRLLRRNAKLTQPNNRAGIVAVISPEHMNVFEKSSQFIDASIYGGRETILNGEIGRWLGIPILVSNYTRQGDADFDGDGSDDQDIWVLGPDAFRVAWKRDPYIETQYFARARHWDIVGAAEWDTKAYRIQHIVRIVADVEPEGDSS